MNKKMAATIALLILASVSVRTVSAHSTSSLNSQINSCKWGHYNSSDWITCGFGESGTIDSSLYAADRATDSHCVYGKARNKSGRMLTVKSCGSARFRAMGTNSPRFANCITGHWWCRWE